MTFSGILATLGLLAIIYQRLLSSPTHSTSGATNE